MAKVFGKLINSQITLHFSEVFQLFVQLKYNVQKLGAVHILCPPPRRGSGESQPISIFSEKGEGGVCQFLTFSDKGGRGLADF